MKEHREGFESNHSVIHTFHTEERNQMTLNGYSRNDPFEFSLKVESTFGLLRSGYKHVTVTNVN